MHSTQHWEESLAPAGPLLAFSELPKGRCPVDTDTISINLVLEGEERYLIGGREYRVGPGEMLIIDPGTRALATLVGSDLVRGISIYLPPTATGAVASVDPGLTEGFRFKAAHHDLGRLLLGVGSELAAGTMPTAEGAAAIIGAAEKTLDMLVAQTAGAALRLASRRPATRRHLLQRVYIARDYLLAHRTRSVCLAELSAMSGLSQFHLTRSFAAVFGMPPLRYHAVARLTAAKDALQAGQVSSAEAFAQYGFSDRSSFARAFHRMFGIYPAGAAGERDDWAVDV